MVDSSDLGAILFILNAVHFQGTWSVGFSQEYTQDEDFTLLDGRAKKIPMMASQSDLYAYYNGSDFEAVRDNLTGSILFMGNVVEPGSFSYTEEGMPKDRGIVPEIFYKIPQICFAFSF